MGKRTDHSLCHVCLQRRQKIFGTSETVINIGCPLHLPGLRLMPRTFPCLSTVRRRKTFNASAIVDDDVNDKWKAPTHAKCCVPPQGPMHLERCESRSLWPTINSSTFVRVEVKYLVHATTNPEQPSEDGHGLTIFFRRTPRYPRHGLTTRLPQV